MRMSSVDEKGVAALSGLPVLLFGLAAVPGSMLIARVGPRRALLIGLWPLSHPAAVAAQVIAHPDLSSLSYDFQHDLEATLHGVPLAEDEVDRASERAQESGDDEHRAHSARTFRHGAAKRWRSTSRPSKPIARATASTLPKTMFVLKTPRWMPSL